MLPSGLPLRLRPTALFPHPIVKRYRTLVSHFLSSDDGWMQHTLDRLMIVGIEVTFHGALRKRFSGVFHLRQKPVSSRYVVGIANARSYSGFCPT